MTSIYQKCPAIDAPVLLVSNIAENKFSLIFIKFKLHKEPKNPANTETCAKECKVRARNSIEGYLRNF